MLVVFAEWNGYVHAQVSRLGGRGFTVGGLGKSKKRLVLATLARTQLTERSEA
jgi:hypothetical protein